MDRSRDLAVSIADDDLPLMEVLLAHPNTPTGLKTRITVLLRLACHMTLEEAIKGQTLIPEKVPSLCRKYHRYGLEGLIRPMRTAEFVDVLIIAPDEIGESVEVIGEFFTSKLSAVALRTPVYPREDRAAFAVSTGYTITDPGTPTGFVAPVVQSEDTPPLHFLYQDLRPAARVQLEGTLDVQDIDSAFLQFVHATQALPIRFDEMLSYVIAGEYPVELFDDCRVHKMPSFDGRTWRGALRHALKAVRHCNNSFYSTIHASDYLAMQYAKLYRPEGKALIWVTKRALDAYAAGNELPEASPDAYPYAMYTANRQDRMISVGYLRQVIAPAPDPDPEHPDAFPFEPVYDRARESEFESESELEYELESEYGDELEAESKTELESELDLEIETEIETEPEI